MGSSAALLPGSMVFLGLWAVACVFFYTLARSKTRDPMNKGDSGKIALISCTIAAICMWIMWISTYMHQMNPLIYPTVITETS